MKSAPGVLFPLVRVCAGVVALSTALLGAAVAAPAGHPGHPPAHRTMRHMTFTTPIQHVIVIVQENRSVDNLFNGWTSAGGNADTVTTDPVSGIALQQCSLDEQTSGCPPGSMLNKACDPNHSHFGGFTTDYDNGKMDGFNTNTTLGCGVGATLSYVPPTETTQYWAFARQYGFVNHALQTNSGPSFPAHQYLIAGQAAGMLVNGIVDSSSPWSIDENAVTLGTPSCLNSGTPYANAISLLSPYPGTKGNMNIPPCNGYRTIFDELSAAGMSWKYYTNSESFLWGGPSAVSQDCGGKNPSTNLCNNTSIVQCSPQALVDFLNTGSGSLPNLTYVIPAEKWSDHAVFVTPDAETGPNWVTWLVNAIGTSPYWSSTAIIVTWDDWGGWFDHYQPGGPSPNLSILQCASHGVVGSLSTPASCGFRVPMIVISPFVRPGSVDTTPTNAAGSILLYIEHTFGLPLLTGPRAPNALGSSDTWTNDDLTSMMSFGTTFRHYVPVPTTTPSSYYTNQACNDPTGNYE